MHRINCQCNLFLRLLPNNKIIYSLRRLILPAGRLNHTASSGLKTIYRSDLEQRSLFDTLTTIKRSSSSSSSSSSNSNAKISEGIKLDDKYLDSATLDNLICPFSKQKLEYDKVNKMLVNKSVGMGFRIYDDNIVDFFQPIPLNEDAPTQR